DRELPDHGLARSGGGGHQHQAALLEGAAAVHLEIVQREGVPAGEGPQLGVLQLLLFGPAGVLLGRGAHRRSPVFRGPAAAGSASNRTAPGSTAAVTGSRLRGSPSESASRTRPCRRPTVTVRTLRTSNSSRSVWAPRKTRGKKRSSCARPSPETVTRSSMPSSRRAPGAIRIPPPNVPELHTVSSVASRSAG